MIALRVVTRCDVPKTLRIGRGGHRYVLHRLVVKCCRWQDFEVSGNREKSDAIITMAALARESWLDVLRLLAQAGAEGLPAGQIGARLGLPSATLSFHLSRF